MMIFRKKLLKLELHLRGKILICICTSLFLCCNQEAYENLEDEAIVDFFFNQKMNLNNGILYKGQNAIRNNILRSIAKDELGKIVWISDRLNKIEPNYKTIILHRHLGKYFLRKYSGSSNGEFKEVETKNNISITAYCDLRRKYFCDDHSVLSQIRFLFKGMEGNVYLEIANDCEKLCKFEPNDPCGIDVVITLVEDLNQFYQLN